VGLEKSFVTVKMWPEKLIKNFQFKVLFLDLRLESGDSLLDGRGSSPPSHWMFPDLQQDSPSLGSCFKSRVILHRLDRLFTIDGQVLYFSLKPRIHKNTFFLDSNESTSVVDTSTPNNIIISHMFQLYLLNLIRKRNTVSNFRYVFCS
jgi:hypothetical protein